MGDFEMLLDPGFELTLRPMRYPAFYEMYRDAIKNTWTVEEVDLAQDLACLRDKLTESEQHLVKRLVAFFATGDSIVANNLVLNLYQHINAPEARMYLARQLYEEALHVQFYLTLLDTYMPDHQERIQAFAAVENIPSIKRKADFMHKWMDSIHSKEYLETIEDRRNFLMNVICFATCVEGLFFFGAFAYVYYLRSKGMLKGLAEGTNWVFRDESMHIEFAMSVVDQARKEEPEILDGMEERIREMLDEAVECELQFSEDCLVQGVTGLSPVQMRQYLEYVADGHLARLGFEPTYGSNNPFSFMELQDVQSLTNFFERRVSEYQLGVTGEVSLDEEF